MISSTPPAGMVSALETPLQSGQSGIFPMRVIRSTGSTTRQFAHIHDVGAPVDRSISGPSPGMPSELHIIPLGSLPLITVWDPDRH